jgi:hypothetical protein
MDIKQELVEKIFDKEAKGRIKVEALWLATSIKQWTVTASLIVHKLGAYPHQNSLALALCELGRVERTLFTLEWLQNSEPRRRVQVGLNKGEAKNALESLPGGRWGDRSMVALAIRSGNYGFPSYFWWRIGWEPYWELGKRKTITLEIDNHFTLKSLPSHSRGRNVFNGTQIARVNPALFELLARIENACWRD